MSNTLTQKLRSLAPKLSARSKTDPTQIFLTIIVLVGVLLLVRFFQQSVLRNTYYLAEALKQQSTSMEIAAQRGIIYAVDAEQEENVILAESVERYAVSATPRHVKHPDRLIPVLVEELGADRDWLESNLTFDGTTQWPENKGNYMSPIAHGLTKEQVESLAAKINSDVSVRFDEAQGDILYFSDGLFFIREYQRVYPENDLAAHVLGYVNFEGQGQYGFEEYNGRDLQGSAGNVAVERDSIGRLLSEVGKVSGRDGYSYVLTIDRNIQYVAERELADAIKKYAADSGSVVILHARTGAVLALANYPTYDPNKFGDVKNVSVFRNAAVASRYEFGSVFKPFTMAAAIDQGLTTSDEVGTYPGSLTIGKYTISNVGKTEYKNITMTEALEFSVNTAMVAVANRLGSEKFHEYITKLGFGQETGIELAGETSGYLIPLDQMKDVSRATISFGQGIDTTAIQIASAYTAIANDGVMVQPHIIDTIIYPDGTKKEVQTKTVGQVFSAETAATVRDMMVSVVTSGHARLANVRGYKIAGKTGTAQISNPAGGYYEDRFRHSFVAIAPSDDPVFIVFTTLENPKNAEYSASSAAPMSGEIAKYLLNYYQIPPTNR